MIQRINQRNRERSSYFEERFESKCRKCQVVIQMQPDTLLLQANETNFRVGENGQMEVTITSRMLKNGLC